MVLNLGCGQLPIKNAINVDLCETGYNDDTVDLSKTPWKWDNDSIDGIYLIHTLEHFPNPLEIIQECHRILKKGGFLFIEVPHSSNVGCIGALEHYRTFSYGISRVLCESNAQGWTKPLFHKELERILWLRLLPQHNPYVEFAVKYQKNLLEKFASLCSYIIQPLIDKSPILFERLWCFYVGGACELVWKGTKL